MKRFLLENNIPVYYKIIVRKDRSYDNNDDVEAIYLIAKIKPKLFSLYKKEIILNTHIKTDTFLKKHYTNKNDFKNSIDFLLYYNTMSDREIERLIRRRLYSDKSTLFENILINEMNKKG